MSCIITYKGQKYSEEQFKEYFINNKQEFDTSIAKNKDVIDSFKRKMEGIDYVFSQSPELASIGSKAQYLQYLSTIFKTSKVKDIVYHGVVKGRKAYNNILQKGFDFKSKRNWDSPKDKTKLTEEDNTGMFFTDLKTATSYGANQIPNPNPEIAKNPKHPDYLIKDDTIISALLNIKNLNSLNVTSSTSAAKFYRENKNKSLIGMYGLEGGSEGEHYNYVVFEPEQIHILGSKQDIEGFKEFVSNQNELYQQVNNSETFQSINKIEDAIAWIKSVLPNANIELVEELIDGIAKGSYNTVTDLITLSEKYADKKTAKHEVFHAAFNRLSKKKQEKLLNEGSKLFGIPRGEYNNDLAIEEKIAEMMENTPDEQLPKTILGRWVQSVRNFFRDLFKERNNISRLLRDINQGRIGKRKTVAEAIRKYQISEDLKSIIVDNSFLERVSQYLDNTFTNEAESSLTPTTEETQEELASSSSITKETTVEPVKSKPQVSAKVEGLDSKLIFTEDEEGVTVKTEEGVPIINEGNPSFGKTTEQAKEKLRELLSKKAVPLKKALEDNTSTPVEKQALAHLKLKGADFSSLDLFINDNNFNKKFKEHVEKNQVEEVYLFEGAHLVGTLEDGIETYDYEGIKQVNNSPIRIITERQFSKVNSVILAVILSDKAGKREEDRLLYTPISYNRGSIESTRENSSLGVKLNLLDSKDFKADFNYSWENDPASKQTKQSKVRYSKKASNKLANTMAEKIRRDYGVEVEVLTNEAIGEMYGKDKMGKPGFTIGNKIVLNKEELGLDTPYHELTHVLLGILKQNNPDLYKEVITKALEHPDKNKIKSMYPELNDEDLGEEIFSTMVGEYISKNYFSSKFTIVNSMKKHYNKFIDWLKSINIFGNPTSDLELSLEQIIKKFGDSSFNNPKIFETVSNNYTLLKELQTKLISQEKLKIICSTL